MIRSETKEYFAWCNLRQRCDNPKHTKYRDYGARGISYPPAWVSFDAFIRDVGMAPSPAHTLDRKKVNEGYSKENCRWVTSSVQQINKRLSQRNNTGLRNVSLNTARQNWIVQIQRDDKKQCLYQGKDFFEACCIAKALHARENI